MIPLSKGVINEAQRQVAFADIIVLNKRDLVNDQEMKELQERVRYHNQIAQMMTAERSRVDLDQILNINAFDPKRALDLDPHLG